MNNRENIRDNLLRADGIDPASVSNEELRWFRGLFRGRAMARRLGRLLAAAAILILAAAGAYFFTGGASRVWAQVLNNVRKTNSFQCRTATERVTVIANDERDVWKNETIMHASEQYGLFLETYTGGKLTATTYVSFDTKEAVRIDYGTEECWRRRSYEARENFSEDMDPRQCVIRVLEGEYSELGRKTVDGRTLAGIESHDSSALFGSPHGYDEFVLRLWIDMETKFPVHTETEYAYVVGAETVKARMVTDQFQWDLDFSADLFTPDIPDGFTLWTDRPDEIACLNSLRLFAECTEGEYPSKLDRGIMSDEMGDVPKTQHIATVRQMASGEFRYDKVWDAHWFRERLIEKGHDVAYYGARVTPADSDSVLMHWDISDTQRRVIWGDLRIETMSVAELTRHCGDVRGTFDAATHDPEASDRF